MANLHPDDTGLPMVVWISERGHARHDVRVKVSRTHGRRARPDDLVSVSVRPTVDLIAGQGLAMDDLRLVQAWIELNRPTIIAYWDGDLSTKAALDRLVPLEA